MRVTLRLLPVQVDKLAGGEHTFASVAALADSLQALHTFQDVYPVSVLQGTGMQHLRQDLVDRSGRLTARSLAGRPGLVHTLGSKVIMPSSSWCRVLPDQNTCCVQQLHVVSDAQAACCFM